MAGIKLSSDTTDPFEEYQKLGNVTKYSPKGAHHIHTDGGGDYGNITSRKQSPPQPAQIHHSLTPPVNE